jgi:tRNA pseudouridine55 synthase
MASGLLIVCFGEATKFSSALLEADKCYSGIIQLGVTTTTGDAEGDVVERTPVAAGHIDTVALASRFLGEITQVPPSYSAIKVQGRPLYAYAREGTAVAAKPRQVHIHALELERDGIDRLRFSVRCGGGTYIRSLAEDIGRAIGCGAHLAALRREGAGGFDVASTVGLEALEVMPDGQRLARLLSPDAALYALPSLTLGEAAVVALLQGRHPELPAGAAVGKSRIYDRFGRFLGVAEASAEARLLPVRLMSTGASAKEPADPC